MDLPDSHNNGQNGLKLKPCLKKSAYENNDFDTFKK